MYLIQHPSIAIQLGNAVSILGALDDWCYTFIYTFICLINVVALFYFISIFNSHTYDIHVYGKTKPVIQE